MKVKFSMNKKNEKKFEKEIKELEPMIESHGLKNINTGHYEGSGISDDRCGIRLLRCRRGQGDAASGGDEL